MIRIYLCTALLLAGGLHPRPAEAQSDEAQSEPRTTAAKRADVELEELRPGVWRHTSYYVYPGGFRYNANGLVVREGDSLMLVDTAWGELLTIELLDLIEAEIGLPIQRVIVTHSHYDCSAGTDVLESRGSLVFVHPLTKQRTVEQGTPVATEGLVALTEPGSSVRIGPVEVFYPGPGHAPDNLMVWVPERKVLFGGCAVRAAAAGSLGNMADAAPESWLEAMKRARERYPQAEIVVPGHGDVGGPDLLAHTLRLLGHSSGQE